MLSLISAVSENGVIGRQGQLPWRIPSDLQYFKKMTTGHALIVGRRTYESIGESLPGRRLIVLTHRSDLEQAGIQVADSLERALALAADDDQPFIGGGTEIYRQSLHLVRRMYLTIVHARLDGDAYFPFLIPSQWRTISSESHPADSRNQYPFTFQVLDRIEIGDGC